MAPLTHHTSLIWYAQTLEKFLSAFLDWSLDYERWRKAKWLISSFLLTLPLGSTAVLTIRLNDVYLRVCEVFWKQIRFCLTGYHEKSLCFQILPCFIPCTWLIMWMRRLLRLHFTSAQKRWAKCHLKKFWALLRRWKKMGIRFSMPEISGWQ